MLGLRWRWYALVGILPQLEACAASLVPRLLLGWSGALLCTGVSFQDVRFSFAKYDMDLRQCVRY